MDDQELNLRLHELETKHRQEIFKQSNQAAIDFAQKTYNYLFLLNGAAATALLAHGKVELQISAIIFAFGALVAIIGVGIAHLYSLLICDTWEKERPQSPKDKVYQFGLWKLSNDQVIKLRLLPTLFVVLSKFLFLFGIIKCGLALNT